MSAMRIFLVLLLMLLSKVSPASQSWQYDLAANSIYDNIIENISDGRPIAGMLHSLYLLEHRAADRKLIALAKYDLGTANSEELGACITNRGSAILPLIDKVLEAIEPCGQRNCLTEEEVISRLARWKNYVEEGEVTEFVP